MRFGMTAALALVLLAPGVAPAQEAAAERGAGAPARRAQAERRLRETLYRVTQRRVGLTDTQMERLGTVTRTLAPQRAALARREREARVVLRRELGATRPDTQAVAAQLEAIRRVRRDRLALQEREAREIAAFMGPVQQARYFSLQEQLRRRVDGMRPGPDAAGAPADQPPRRRRPL